MPVRILTEETINKIAAGEVVERPANAVKELVENALDAQARLIEIETAGAGRNLIRVRDNGTGMPREDLELAVIRHATSKISNFNDLTSLTTMGFRGEALPSIAAVSRLHIQSQPRAEQSGWEISVDGGKVKESRAWAGATGTIVEVRDLFFNTPARAKFLKTDTTERHRIAAILEETALARPEIAFRVIAEGKTQFDTPPATDITERVMDVLGKAFASTLLRVEVDIPQVQLLAFCTRAQESRTARDHQFLFVNQRPVNLPKSMMRALYDAYSGQLAVGRHPGALLYLTVDPADVDVNIHPTKREVRFAREQEMYQLLYRAIRQAVASTPLTYAASSPAVTSSPGSGPVGSVPPMPKTFFHPSNLFEAVRSSGLYNRTTAPVPVQTESSFEKAPQLRMIGTIFDLYVLAQDNDTLLIIDQHAAAERVRYERYLAQSKRNQIAVQPLLLPETIELLPSSHAIICDHLAVLRSAGWDIAEFGPQTVRIAAIPAVLGARLEARSALAAITAALANETQLPPSEKIERIIRAACRSSIKAGDPLDTTEAERLLKDLFMCETPYTCPHGRPTLMRMPLSELEKHFRRDY